MLDVVDEETGEVLEGGECWLEDVLREQQTGRLADRPAEVQAGGEEGVGGSHHQVKQHLRPAEVGWSQAPEEEGDLEQVRGLAVTPGGEGEVQQEGEGEDHPDLEPACTG